ncbi:MAG: co-chaperone DjlA [Gammaproteobacteria bacterium]|nr:co-chaperone DjlA [Gammaproteobacteria bacterium]
MGWWGKIIGGAFGFMLGGPLGALLGAALGHNLDKGLGELPDAGSSADRERVQTAFFTATFSVMGYLCKSDGRVSEHEIAMARNIMRQMDLSRSQEQLGMRLFQEGRGGKFPLDDVLLQLRHEARNRRSLLRMFLEIQLAAAFADGALDSVEKRLLLNICDRIGVSRAEYEHLEAMVGAQMHSREPNVRTRARGRLEDAYAILNVTAQASVDEIKRAYRRLLSQHHPDKLVAKGLPEEMMKLATQKTHEIRQAYEQIREARGF